MLMLMLISMLSNAITSAVKANSRKDIGVEVLMSPIPLDYANLIHKTSMFLSPIVLIWNSKNRNSNHTIDSYHHILEKILKWSVKILRNDFWNLICFNFSTGWAIPLWAAFLVLKNRRATKKHMAHHVNQTLEQTSSFYQIGIWSFQNTIPEFFYGLLKDYVLECERIRAYIL